MYIPVWSDDILVTAQGAKHEQTFAHIFDATIDYIHEMGGIVATDKTVAFSTNRLTRDRIGKVQWRSLEGGTIKTTTSVRDLGTHMNTGSKMYGTTISKRLDQAASIADRLRYKPCTHRKKGLIITMLVLAKALWSRSRPREIG